MRYRLALRDGQSTDSWLAFGRGFRQRNPLVLVAAALVTLVALFVLQGILFDGGLTAVDEGRLLRIPHDDYLHVSVKVQQLKEHPPATRTVYLFGGSGTMECIVSEASLAGQIGHDAKQPVQVVSLAAHQESMAMTLALVDNLPPGPATIAIGLAPIRLDGAPSRDASLLAGHTLLVRSPRLDQVGPKYFGKTANAAGAIPGIFDYLGSYLHERGIGVGTALWGARIKYAPHYYPWGATGASPLGKRRNVLTVLATDAKLYRQNADYNFAMLEDVLKLAQERGYSVVLYDQPLNASAAGPTWNGVVPAYHKRARALAARYGVPYIDVEHAVKLTDGDFADLFHLLAPGRLKWQPVMARELASTLGAPPAEPVAAAAERTAAALR